jgi:hypothetical protein
MIKEKVSYGGEITMKTRENSEIYASNRRQATVDSQA